MTGLLVVVALLGAGCGGSGDDASEPDDAAVVSRVQEVITDKLNEDPSLPGDVTEVACAKKGDASNEYDCGIKIGNFPGEPPDCTATTSAIATANPDEGERAKVIYEIDESDPKPTSACSFGP